MNSTQKIAQYLGEALASEDALVRVLQSQIAMTPEGSYRTALETHLNETRRHAARVGSRLSALDTSSTPLHAVVGFWEDVVGQTVALAKTPFDLAIERLARSVGDDETADLAASILADEEKMLARIRREIPKLTDAVVRSELRGDPSYDVTKTGAADAVRTVRARSARAAAKTSASTRRTARKARKVPGVAQAEGQVKGAVASEGDLAISGYDGLTADEITSRLPNLSQIDLAKIEAYERKNQDRTTILSRVETLRGAEPWPGYDELKAAEVQSALSDADAEHVGQVGAYERSHKNRAGVLKAAERERASA
jgi:ferritin-like metal-binding protein YciE